MTFPGELSGLELTGAVIYIPDTPDDELLRYTPYTVLLVAECRELFPTTAQRKLALEVIPRAMTPTVKLLSLRWAANAASPVGFISTCVPEASAARVLRKHREFAEPRVID